MPEETRFSPVARSPFAGRSVMLEEVSMKPVESLGAINLRLVSEGARIAAERVLGVDIPTVPNTFTSGGAVSAFWLGPDEWMIQAPGRKLEALHARLEKHLSDHHASVTVVSDHTVAIGLSGPGARRILEKGCPLDLHPRAFAAGACGQSHFLQATLLIAKIDDAPTYLIRTRRSMAEYLWEALDDAARKEQE